MKKPKPVEVARPVEKGSPAGSRTPMHMGGPMKSAGYVDLKRRAKSDKKAKPNRKTKSSMTARTEQWSPQPVVESIRIHMIMLRTTSSMAHTYREAAAVFFSRLAHSTGEDPEALMAGLRAAVSILGSGISSARLQFVVRR